MPIKKTLLLYVLTVPVFFLIDMIWLGLIAKGFYRKYLGTFLSPNVKWTAAVIFYLLFIAGIIIFVVQPGLAKGSLGHTVVLGLLFGLMTYATYDLTNLATMKNWPLIVVFVDTCWGMVLTASVGSISFLIARKLM